MAVAGDLADFGVPDLLYMVKMRGLTGRLMLQRGDDDAVLHFQDGRLVRVASARVSQHLGELLVYLGRLTEEQLGQALALQSVRQETEPLGALLIEHGLVTPEDLDDVLRCQAEEILYRVLAWSDGTFAYAAASETGPAVPLPEINVEKLILEAVRQGDEWEAIRQRIPSLDCRVTLVKRGTGPLTLPLSLKESMVVASIARGATQLRAVAEATRLTEAELVRLVDEMVSRGVVEVAAPVSPAVMPGRLSKSGLSPIMRAARRHSRSSYVA